MGLVNYKISHLLIAGFATLITLMLLMAGFGLYEVSNTNKSINAIYDDRVVPLEQINVISDMYAINIMDTANKYSVGSLDPKQSATLWSEGVQKIDDNWKAYIATFLTDEEKQAVARVADLMQKSKTEMATIGEAIKGGRNDTVMERSIALDRAVTPIRQELRTLVEIQLKEAKAEHDRAEISYQRVKLVFSIVVVIGVAIGLGIAWLLVRSITGPLEQAADVARQVAGGDLTQQIDGRGKSETAVLLTALKDMQDGLVRVVSAVREGSEGVASASSEIAQGNHDLSSRTESQASALEETAASMEELSSTVKQNADSARQANQLAQSASSVAIQGGQVVSQVVETMRGINESSRKISDIISVIDGIAFQTNILALNAAVEAARAGEQGRGFAVVASEVRSLAGRSADAAKEIKSLIGTSVERVGHGSALVDRAGETMTEVVNSIRRVTDIMGEISAASNEQSLGVQQVGDAVSQMDQVTQQNAALVEQMAAAASSLKGLASSQVEAVAVFKLPREGGNSLMLGY